MDDTVIVLMLKNNETGFLETEIGSYSVGDNEGLLYNIFARKDGEEIKTHMKITVDKELEDWEYSAVYDYYDPEALGGICSSVIEDDSGYNPIWEVVFDFDENVAVMEAKISKILRLHADELESVYKAIAELKDEYEQPKT